MSFQPKKLLVVLEINHLLFYLNNPKHTEIAQSHSHKPINYHDSYQHLRLSIRAGKPQLLNYLFINLRADIDVAVWSNLSNQYTNDLCKKYFTRYYRDLLFVLATNRPLYGNHPQHTSLPIRKDLSGVFNRFAGYNQTNTIVVTAQSNLMENHSRNDLKVPPYSPSSPTFQQDPGLIPLAKYLQGLLIVKNQSGINDIRRFIGAKQAKNIFARSAHNLFTDRTYI